MEMGSGSIFLLLYQWEKKGLLASIETLKGGRMVVAGCSTLSRCPQLHPFREPGGNRGVCVCMCVKSVRGGGSY